MHDPGEQPPIHQAHHTAPPPPPPRTAQAPWLVDHMILPLLMPVAVIKGQWRSVSLGKAYLAHLYGLVIALIGLAGYDILHGYLNEVYYDYYWGGYSSSVIMSAFAGNAEAAYLLTTGLAEFLIASQIGYFFAAFATMAWGAGPEPWRKSYGRAIRRWWQLTPWHAALTLVVMGVFTAIEFAAYDGFYVTQFFSGSVLMICALLVLFVTLRGLAVHERADGWPGACKWPMTCEGCGYALVGTAIDQDCPECGMPVAHSAEFSRGRLIALKPFKALLLGATQPTRVGQWMFAHRPMTGAGQVLARAIALMILTAPLGIFIAFGIIVVMTGEGFSINELGEILLAMIFAFLFTSGGAAASMVALALFGASFVGTFYRVFFKRRAMHIAGQAAGYLSGVLPLWLLGNWVGFGLFAGVFVTSFMSSTPAWFVALPIFWFLYNLVFGIVYLVMVGRVIKATRWANI